MDIQIITQHKISRKAFFPMSPSTLAWMKHACMRVFRGTHENTTMWPFGIPFVKTDNGSIRK